MNWDDPLSPRQKAALVAEILPTYMSARRHVRSNQLLPVTERLRASGQRRAPVAPADHRPAALHLASAVNRVLRLLPTDSRCLTRSLVLTTLLARREIPSVLVLAARTEPTFAAHAWVEVEGRALLPPGDSYMQRLVEV